MAEDTLSNVVTARKPKFTDKPRSFSVYVITNLINGKQYIGITCISVKRRWYAHKCMSRDASKCGLLQKAMRKYGEDNFSIEEIACARNWEDLCVLESIIINDRGTFKPGGYNLTTGGEGNPGWKPTQQYIERQRKAQTGKRWTEERKKLHSERSPHKGKQAPWLATPEAREKSAAGSSARRGYRHKPESIEKMSLRAVGLKKSPEAVAKSVASKRKKGRTLTEESRDKMRSAVIKNHTQEAKDAIRRAKLGKKRPQWVVEKVAAGRRRLYSRRRSTKELAFRHAEVSNFNR